MATGDDFEKHPPIGEDDPVPRVPRGRGVSLRSGEVMRIIMFAALLVAVIAMRKPCSAGVASFMGQFDSPLDAGAKADETRHITAPQLPQDLPEGVYVKVGVDDDPEEVKKKIEAAQAKAEAMAKAKAETARRDAGAVAESPHANPPPKTGEGAAH